MIDLYGSLLCSIESKIASIACKESYFMCIGKKATDLHEKRLTLLSVWYMFDGTLTSSDLSTIDCWYTKHYGTKSIIKQVVESTAGVAVNNDDVFGCTIPGSVNYNPAATINDGTCIPANPVYGCTDGITPALNYDASATVDNGTCEYNPVVGPYNYIDKVCSTFIVTSDISYSDSDSTLVMDSYVEDCNTNTNRPAVLILHGGGGTKTNLGIVSYCQDFASRGYKAYAIEYGETGGGSGFTVARQKAAVRNTSACIRWLRAHAASEGINTLNIFIGGDSAGAITSVQTNVGSRILDISNPLSPYYNPTSPEYDTYFAGAINAENPSYSSVPTATFTQSGAVNSAVANFITASTKKNFFYHGTIDCKVPYSKDSCGVNGALENVNTLISLGVASTLTPYLGEGHGIGSHRPTILDGGDAQISGIASGDYASNTFVTDIGVVRKFAALLSP